MQQRGHTWKTSSADMNDEETRPHSGPFGLHLLRFTFLLRLFKNFPWLHESISVVTHILLLSQQDGLFEIRPTAVAHYCNRLISWLLQHFFFLRVSEWRLMTCHDLQHVSSGDIGVHGALHFYCGLINHQTIDRWSCSVSAAETWDDGHGVDDGEIRTQRPCASLSCHGALNTISSLSCLPKHSMAVWGTPGRELSKICRPDLDTHRWHELWRIKGNRRWGEKE